jgi:phosphoribosylformylglycinamidine cyclo-ligase
MCVNDLLTIGAEPFLFLDYFATGKLDVRQATAVVRGIARGCRQARVALVGGETAELPSFYARGEYDLAGFAVGVVERRRIIDGRAIRPGDALIGLPSPGLHSTGFAHARRVLLARARLPLGRRLPGARVPLGTELLRPTRIYVRTVRDLLAHVPPGTVRGMAHITGGGLPGNVPRMLPAHCRAEIRRGSWATPAIFDAIEHYGRVPRAEMDRTFNNGIGFVLAVAARRLEPTLAQFELFEDARSETARLGWEPFMYNPSLGHLLEGVTQLPTLLIWGEEDAVVPRGCIDAYQKAIPSAQVVTIPNVGHRPEVEAPETFIQAVKAFLSS